MGKKERKKRDHNKIRKVALNNKTGKSITERPKEADERTEPGHWEIDLVIGRKKAQTYIILTLVDRKTRKSLYVLSRNKHSRKCSGRSAGQGSGQEATYGEVFKTITQITVANFWIAKGLRRPPVARKYTTYTSGSKG